MTALFTHSKPVIGVIHVGALPGTPRSLQTVTELVRQAKDEARVYRECGVDGVIIENMHDVPYLKGEVGPEIVAAGRADGDEGVRRPQLLEHDGDFPPVGRVEVIEVDRGGHRAAREVARL